MLLIPGPAVDGQDFRLTGRDRPAVLGRGYCTFLHPLPHKYPNALSMQIFYSRPIAVEVESCPSASCYRSNIRPKCNAYVHSEP